MSGIPTHRPGRGARLRTAQRRWRQAAALVFSTLLLLGATAAHAVFTTAIDNLQINEGDVGNIDVFANDTITEPGARSIIRFDNIIDGGTGTATTGPEGNVTFTTNPGASGGERFEYQGRTAEFFFIPEETSDTGILHIGISPVAGEPLLGTPNSSGDEDTSIALGLSVSTNTAIDNDGSETITAVKLSGVPVGASLSAGMDLGGGMYSLNASDVSGLSLTPPDGFSGDIALTLEATVEDTATIINMDGVFEPKMHQASDSSAFTVTVNPVAVAATVTANDVSGNEDTAIALDISVAPEADGSDTITGVVISPVPADVTLSAGTRAGTDITLSEAQLVGLTLTPAPGFDGVLNLTVQVTSEDDGDTAVGMDTFTVTVAPVAVAATVVANDVSGNEDTAIALDISVAPAADSGDTIASVVITPVPADVTLSAGTRVGTEITLSEGQLAGLTLTPAPGFDGMLNLTVQVTSEDGGATAMASDAFTVTVAPVAVAATVVANDVSGNEDTTIALDISVAAEADGSDTITAVVITPVPADVTLSAGTRAGTDITLSEGQLAGLTLTPAPGFSGVLNLTVQVTTEDGGDTAVGMDTFAVTVNPVAETPTVAANNVTGLEDVATPLEVTAATTDADGSDVLREVILSGFPVGTTVSGALDQGGGQFSVNMGNFGGVTALLTSGLAGTFTINVEAVAEDAPATASAFTTFDLVVDPVADAPVITANNVSGPEESLIPLALNVVTNPSDPDGSESIASISISGVPNDWTLSNASDTGGGVWSVSAAQITNVGAQPPLDFVGTVALNIEAQTLDQVGASNSSASANKNFSVAVTNVNDGPRVEAPIADVTVNEDAGPVVINLGAAFSDPDEASGDDLTYAITGVAVLETINPISSSSAVGEVLTINLGANRNGRVDVTVTATDGAGAQVQQSFELIVLPVDDPPVVVGPINDITRAEDSGPVGVAFAGRFSDPDELNGDSLTFTGVASGNTGLITVALIGQTELEITFVPNAFGSTTVTLTLEDTQGNVVTDQFDVTVTPVNDAPKLTTQLDNLVINEDSGAQSTSLNDHYDDVDNADSTLTFSVSSSVPGLFSEFSVTAGVLAFTPALNQHGVATVTVFVQDPGGLQTVPASATFTITVNKLNDPPFVATPIIAEVRVDEDADPFNVSFAGVFDDPDLATDGSETLTFTFAANDTVPVALDIAISGESVNITLIDNAHHEDFAPADGITDTFAEITVTATDAAGLSVDQTFRLYVNPEGDTPDAVDDTVTVAEDSGVTPIMVLANDFDEDGPVTLTLGDGSLSGSSDGTSVITNELGDELTVANGQVNVDSVARTIGYLPRTNFSGADTFTYRITDVDGQVDTATVTVTVTPSNDPPVGTALLEYSIVENTSLTLVAPGVLQNASDADGDDVDVDLLTLPLEGTLTFNEDDGSFVYVPEANFIGLDSFTYRLTDGNTFNADGDYTVEITVTEAPPPPEPPPPGEVEFDFDLASTPLEEAVGAEANVLVVMDDSGSMDWSMMNPQAEGRFALSSQGLTTPPAQSALTFFSYLFTLPTDTYDDANGSGRSLPAQETLDADADFDGNNYGVWRARTSRYNTIYYDPEVEYVPWIGLDTNNAEYADSIPTMAALDPTQFDPLNPLTYIDLTAPFTYTSDNVPAVSGPAAAEMCTDFGFFIFCSAPEGKDIVNTDYYIPRYYTSTADNPLAFNSQHTLVEIRDPNTDGDANPATNPVTFARGRDRDCDPTGDPSVTSCSLDQELQNFANWFSYYRSREYVAKAALGTVISDSFNLRIGYVTLNDSNARESIASMNASFRTGEKKELLDEVYDINSDGGTPLRTALNSAGRHFECLSGDSFGSSASSSPGDAGCPVFAAPEGQCQSNFTLLFTDGTWNGAGPAEDRDGPAPGNTEFDGGVFADGRAGTLADVAMHYYERDLHSLIDSVATSERDLLFAPEGTFGADDETMHQHMKTYTIGFGVDGNLTDDDIPETFDEVLPMGFDWGDPFNSNLAKIDDLRHAALNGRGQYLAGNNSTLLSEAFRNAFNDFQRGSTSVSAVSLNSNELDAETVRFRASFNLKLKSGEISAIKLGSDGNPEQDMDGNDLPPIWRASAALDAKLPSNRVIITSSNGADGVDTGTPFRFATPAGPPNGLDLNQQALLSPDEIDYLRGVRTQERPLGVLRERPDTNGLLGDFVHSDPIFVGAPSALGRDRAPFPITDLYSEFAELYEDRTPVLYAGANDGMLHGFDARARSVAMGGGAELLAYIPNKLIDIGEQFRNDLSQITSPAYGHEFFVDLTPAVSDVYMYPRQGSLLKSWNTVLMGGYEAGAKGYFLLNVTDPSQFTEANANKIVLWEFTEEDDTYPADANGDALVDVDGDPLLDLAGAPVRDLGYSFSEVTLQMSNVTAADGQKEWMAVFGNGYNSTHGVAKLFVLFLDRGLDGWDDAGDFVKLDTGFGVQAAPHVNAGLPNGLGTPALIDENGDGTVDLAYAGDLLGNLYRFDLCGRQDADDPCDTDANRWSTTRLFTATYTDPDTSEEIPQPITQKPLVRKHPTETEGFVVVFGTGSYITENDGVSTDIQSVYGIWDRVTLDDNPSTAASDAKSTVLVQQTMSKAIVSLGTPAVERTLRILTSNPVDYTLAAGADRKFGWYFNLDVLRPATKVDGSANDETTGNLPPSPQFPGERAIRRFILRNDFVTTSTVVPRELNTCLRAPPGSIINFDFARGGNPNQPVLDLNNDGLVDGDDLITIDGQQYAAGLEFSTDDLDGTLVDLTILGDADSDILFVSGGEDTEGIRITGTVDDKTGRLTWRELDEAN